VTITAAPAFRASSMQGTEARMRVSFGDAAGVVQRHVQVGADEHALACELALGARSSKRRTFMGGQG
jgi:hypothetical protein